MCCAVLCMGCVVLCPYPSNPILLRTVLRISVLFLHFFEEMCYAVLCVHCVALCCNAQCNAVLCCACVCYKQWIAVGVQKNEEERVQDSKLDSMDSSDTPFTQNESSGLKVRKRHLSLSNTLLSR
jgi:hypothetical protein